MLKKIHRVMQFKQSNFLKTYINYFTQKRANSKTPFAKRMWKLFVNAIYGKFIEQIRNYLECKICNSLESAKKAITNVRFSSLKIISKNLVVIFLKPDKLVFNKAYPIGFTILELSKFFMFREYYECFRPKLKNCEVLFSDTDSFALAVFSKNKVDNIKKLENMLDFSNYNSTHPRYNTKHKNALGYWKDELEGAKIQEYVGLRSKCYALQIKKNNKINLKSTCKGVRKGYKKNNSFRQISTVYTDN